MATQAAVASGCLENLADTEGAPVGLVATYELQAPARTAHGPTRRSSVAVRFVGQREGAEGTGDPKDRFDRVERVDGLPAGAGRVTVSTRATDVNAGRWRVVAEPVGDAADADAAAGPGGGPQAATVRTQFAPLLHGPGIRLAAWPVLVLLGVVLALAVQGVLLGRRPGPWHAPLLVSVGSVAVGYVGAKVWYLVMHHQGPRQFVTAGTYIQGFVLGTFTTAAAVLAATGQPVGAFLDATAPGLFLAMAVGRPGCFLGGCCVGRPTASRWGAWSSDRRVGVRRVPVQLLEAVTALVLGLVALAVELDGPLPVPGLLFVGGMGAYTAARQLLFPLRREPRRTTAGRRVALAVSTLTVVLAVASSVVASTS